ncbi:MAG: hypothetical protein HY744_29940 [Deltaproteobacteria bacterium]|nr:hypothetical protein [Deltaproteobacteria bacterium]
MLRRATAFAVRAALLGLVVPATGCSGEPDPKDLCTWLKDSNNCYARFANDVEGICARPYQPGSDPVASATGYFATREALDICIKNEGGQVIFDPPLDVTAFPPTAVAFKLLDETAQPCGSGSFATTSAETASQSFSIGIDPIDANDAGAATAPDGGPLGDHVVGGTFASALLHDRQRFEISCAGGQETHNFNNLLLQKCPERSYLLPRAILDASPGRPESAKFDSRPGFVRLRIEYPPAVAQPGDEYLPGAAERIYEYFNCIFPAPPHPCEDGIKAAREFDLAFPRCGVMGRAARGGGGQR